MIKVRAVRAPWSYGVELLIEDVREGYHAVVRDVEFSTVQEAEQIGPSLVVKPDAAQQLMDELWWCGLRPSEGSGSAGSLAATERHLKDMQKLTFDMFEELKRK